VLFLGVHGVHPEAGLTTPNVAEAEMLREIELAGVRVIVAGPEAL
jgi:DeoR/GlpR family transcriptional regulator of sugar metabolism